MYYQSVRFWPGGHRAILVHLSDEDRVAPRGATYRYFIGFISVYEGCGQTRIKNVLFSMCFTTKVEPVEAQMLIFHWFYKLV